MKFILILMPVFFLASQLTAAESVSLSYVVAPQPEEQIVQVRSSIQNFTETGSVVLGIQRGYASVDDFYSEIHDLRVVEPQNVTIDNFRDDQGIHNNLWHIKAEVPFQNLILEYKMKTIQTWPGEKVRFKAAMNEERYYSNGYPVFVTPRFYGNGEPFYVNEIDVEFELPSNWQAYSSFQNENSDHKPRTFKELLYSSIALGDYRHQETSLANGSRLRVALAGNWTFEDHNLVERTRSLIDTQIGMMNTWESDRYFTVLTPTFRPNHTSGSGLEHAFEMFAHESTSVRAIDFLLSHENFHYWVGHRIKTAAPRNRWFNEGITTWYTYLFLARSGLWTAEETLTRLSRNIEDYEYSPVSDSANFAFAGQWFWNWYEYQNLFYTKGMVIGMAMDHQIRFGSFNAQTLDHFIRHLDAKYGNTSERLDDKVILHELNEWSGTSWEPFFARYIDGIDKVTDESMYNQGGLTDPRRDCHRSGAGLVLVPNFCPGNIPCQFRVSSVMENSPAWEAGLRPNDHVIQSNYSSGQPNQNVEVSVVDPDGTVRRVAFFSGMQTESCPALQLDPEASELAREIAHSIWDIAK